MSIDWWQGPIILTFFTLLSLLVAFVLWKFLPGTSEASFQGKKWKLGGSFAGFVFAMYMMNNLYIDIENNINTSKRQNIADQLSLIGSPDTAPAYKKLFRDLDTGSDFLAFNAPFRVESLVGLEESAQLHAKRYIEDNIHSKYIFLDKVSYQRGLKFFNVLKNTIGKEKFNKHVNYVLWEDAPISSCNSYFITKKDNKEVFIFYPNPHGQQAVGIPEYVVIITGAIKKNKIWSIYKTKFNRYWGMAMDQLNKKKKRETSSSNEREL